MDKPHIADAPGLAWRPRKNGWTAIWLARQDLVKKGFRPSSVSFGTFTEQPSEAQALDIRRRCVELQCEMYGQRKGPTFEGLVRGLINAYQTDKDSPYQGMAYKTRLHTDALLKRIDAKIGPSKLSDLTAREFMRLYNEFRWPDGEDGRELIPTAHAALTAVRMIVGYGATFEIEGCRRLKEILSGLKFENGKARTEAMTIRQCEDIIAAAHRLGFPSIALVQAIQFDLRVRQSDVIGQWVPIGETGISTVPPYSRRKWLRGIRWEEISSGLVLSHPASKTGKLIERNLSLYPMIMAELDRIPGDKRKGPIVICELTGRPWKQNHFRMKWRHCADAAGVPKSLYNMDSRAGGITETIEATGGNVEAARKEAQHADLRRTVKYSRLDRGFIDNTAAAVLEFRAKNRT